jgi:N-acyl-phosphatidylethanolamine-hydrolysing phospholipase D
LQRLTPLLATTTMASGVSGGASPNIDTNTNASSSTGTTNERSTSEIEGLVQKRVQERDGWAIHGIKNGSHPSSKEVREFMSDVISQYFKFKPMQQAELDEHFPVLEMNWERLQNPPADEIQITWLGHSSLLVQMNGYNIVTDPVFSDRCSFSQWFGPKRFRQPPCSVTELTSLVSVDLVLISHNHYDHLDYQSVRDFAASSSAAFVVPLGLREWFQEHVSDTIAIYEQDWHESMEFVQSNDHTKSLRITSIPMRHWSNRVGDRDKTLWCGYSIEAPESRFLFTGDTAWYDDIVKIGEQYGPFDLAAIPIGAYAPRDFMKYNHVDVEEAVRLKDAFQAKAAVPIHWGTFPLTTEPVMEPRELLHEMMKSRADVDSFKSWLIGETKQF